MWLVRNYDDRLFLYKYKPIKRIHCGWWESKEDNGGTHRNKTFTWGRVN